MDLPDWERTTLGDLAEIRRGASPRPIKDPKWFSETGPGWVRISDVTRSNRVLRETEQSLSAAGAAKSVPIRPGDLIMSICATIGKPIISGIEACIHDGFVAFFDTDSGVSKDFLYYFLQWKEREFSGKGQPGTQKNLNTTIVGSTELLLPPLPEQRKIAAILSSVDEAIEKTQAVIDQVQVVKKGLMQELLTRGIPGRHKKFKQTEIGEIPEEWEVQFLHELVVPDSSITYGVVKPGPRDPAGVRFVRSGDIVGGRVAVERLRTITGTISQQYRRTLLRGGELLVALVGQPGATAIAPPSLAGANIARQVGLVRLGGRVAPLFVKHYLNSPVGRKALLHESLGSVQQVINLKDLKNVLIPTPPFHEQQEIAATLSAADKAIQQGSLVLEQQRFVKQALMSVLLTGELRVLPQAEAAE